MLFKALKAILRNLNMNLFSIGRIPNNWKNNLDGVILGLL